RAVAEIDQHLGLRVGHQDQVAIGAERAVPDGPEGGDVDVGRRPADSLGHPGLQVPAGKALAPHLAGDVAVAEHDEVVAKHRLAPSVVTTARPKRGHYSHFAVLVAKLSARPPAAARLDSLNGRSLTSPPTTKRKEGGTS